MSAFLTLAAIGYIIFAVLNIFSRPGHFAAVYLLSYGLAVFFGSIGPIAGAVSLVATFAAFNAHKERLSVLPAEWFLAVWIGTMLLSMFTTPQMDITVVYVASIVLLAAGSYLYARAFATAPHFFEDLLLGSVIITTLCAIRIFQMTDTIGVLGDSINMTHVGLATLPELALLGVISFLIFHRPHPWWVSVGLLLFMFGLVFPFTAALGTRSVILSVGIASVLLLGLRIFQEGGGKIIGIISVGLGLIVTLIAVFWTELQTSRYGILVLVGSSRLSSGAGAGNLEGDTSAQLRFELYDQAWRIFFRHPIFGSGAGSFGYLADGANGAYPHNMFLEILVQSGLFGLAIYSLFFIPLAVKGLRQSLQSPASWNTIFPLSIFISALIRHQVSMTITQGKLFFFALGCFAAYAVATEKSASRTSENGTPQTQPS